MRKRTIAGACLSVMILLLTQGSASLIRAKGQRAPRAFVQIASAAGSTSHMAAIIELDSDSVVAHQTSLKLQGKGRQALALDSSEARAYETQLIDQQEDFISRASIISPGMQVITRLRKLANAISISAGPNEIARISTLPGVRRVELTQEYYASTDSSIALVNAPTVWGEIGGQEAAGRGIRIAIIDSGVDAANPLFADAGFEAPAGFPRGDAAFTNNKVIVAKAYLADKDATPVDEHGHGTNVAGIAAGNFNTSSPLGKLSGVAPKAFIGNYRVLNKDGTGRNDLIARGLEEAISDHFDIANMSLGGTPGTELNFLDRTVENAVEAGMVVVVSAGNSGAKGEMSITSPAIAPSAISVTATTNSHTVGPVINVTSPSPVLTSIESIRSTQGTGGTTSSGNIVGPMPAINVSAIDVQSRGCSNVPTGSLNGKVALVERGVCSFPDKINALDKAGASAVIVFNKDLSEGSDGGDNLLSMDVRGTKIPAFFIGRSDGISLQNWITQHQNAEVRLLSIGEASFPQDLVVGSNSTGPTTVETLKPDMAAPGVFIYSGATKIPNPAGVSDPSGFLAVSGTSQAAPHVAGGAALIKQLHLSWSPQQIKSALMNSAADVVFTSPERSSKAGVLSAGTGRLDLAKASSVTATLSPASISFGIIKLKKKVSLSKDLKIKSVVDGQGDFTITLQELDPGDGVSVTKSATSVSLAGGQTATISLSIAAAKSAAKRDYTGFIVITDSRGQTLRVPYWVRFVKKKK